MNYIESRIKELTYILNPIFNLEKLSPELYARYKQELNQLLQQTDFKGV